MSFYLLQASYSEASVKAMVSAPQDRSGPAKALVEAIGGTLHHMFFSFGDYDIVAIIEAPDDTAMAAGVMALSSAGTVSAVKTTKLMTTADAVEAMTKAGEVTGRYTPPSN